MFTQPDYTTTQKVIGLIFSSAYLSWIILLAFKAIKQSKKDDEEE